LGILQVQDSKWGIVHINDKAGHRIEGASRVYELHLSGDGLTLYAILRDAEENQIEYLLFTPIDAEEAQAAAAMMDRIRRASSKDLL